MMLKKTKAKTLTPIRITVQWSPVNNIMKPFKITF